MILIYGLTILFQSALNLAIQYVVIRHVEIKEGAAAGAVPISSI